MTPYCYNTINVNFNRRYNSCINVYNLFTILTLNDR